MSDFGVDPFVEYDGAPGPLHVGGPRAADAAALIARCHLCGAVGAHACTGRPSYAPIPDASYPPAQRRPTPKEEPVPPTSPNQHAEYPHDEHGPRGSFVLSGYAPAAGYATAQSPSLVVRPPAEIPARLDRLDNELAELAATVSAIAAGIGLGPEPERDDEPCDPAATELAARLRYFADRVFVITRQAGRIKEQFS